MQSVRREVPSAAGGAATLTRHPARHGYDESRKNPLAAFASRPSAVSGDSGKVAHILPASRNSFVITGESGEEDTVPIKQDFVPRNQIQTPPTLIQTR